MKLADICIKRPVLAIVLNLILVMIGISCYFYLDTRFFPKFEPKKINITTSFAGASPELIETAITNPLEAAFSTVSGIETMTSESSRGLSNIEIRLQPSADVDEVANQLRDQISAAQSTLPDGVQPPTVEVGSNQNDFMDIAFTDPFRSPEQIRDYLERYVVNSLLQVPGIGNNLIEGADKYAVRINLNPDALAAHRLAVDTVQAALLNNNIEMPAGQIKSHSLNFPITAKTAFYHLDDFRQLILSHNNNQIIRLQDVASVILGPATSDKSLLLINQQPGVILDLSAQDDASPLAISKAIQGTLSQIKNNLPAGMKMLVFYNNAVFLKAAINEVYFSIAFAIICVLIAVFLFLGTWRAISIPIATIPICLISSFAILFLLNFTINVITLLALVLSIGLVVDDAIVMLENIHRYIEKGLPAKEAAFIGSRQIGFAIIGMTISLAAVYAPVGLIHTKIAVIFREFAYTLAGAVLISGFVALTLSPMMCSRLLRPEDLHTPYVTRLETFFEKLRLRYQSLLQLTLEKKRWVLLSVFLFATIGIGVFKSIPSQFMPAEDMGFVIAVLNTPTGASFDYAKKQAILAEKAIKHNSNIETTGVYISDAPDSFNNIFIVLKPYNQRSKTAKEIAEEINAKLNQQPGLNAFVFAPSPFSGASHQDLEFSLMTSGSYQDLYHTIDKLKKSLLTNKSINNINSNMDFDSQQYEVTVNRDLAAAMGVNIRNIDNTIAALLGGQALTKFNQDNYSYDVILQADDSYLHSLDSLNQFYLQGDDHNMVPIGNLIHIQPTLGEETLPHYNRLRSADISAQLGEDNTLGQAMNVLNHELPRILPNNTKFAFTGLAKNLQDNNSSMMMVFILALVFIYLVLAALFESFIDPCIVLFTVPLSIVGALIALKISGGSLNIYTDIGLITLIGLISKHGILITQFINEIRSQGQELTTAVLEGASIRLRPILMTTTAMIFGALPLIFTGGASAASRQQIGLVIIAGLLVGTLFSLFVVPVAYVYFSQLKRR